MQQKELAKALGVNKFSVNRYEGNQSKPNRVVRLRLKKRFGLHGELERLP